MKTQRSQRNKQEILRQYVYTSIPDELDSFDKKSEPFSSAKYRSTSFGLIENQS